MQEVAGTDHTDTIKYRLAQVEAGLNDLTQKVGGLATEVSKWEDRRAADRLLPDRVRKLEDDSLEIRVYLRQAKWVAAGVVGAFVVGLVNLLLNLSVIKGLAP